MIEEGPDHSKLSDGQLWTQLKANDQHALNTIYLRYIRSLYNYGFKIAQDDKLVEDVIQDLFVDFWEKRHRLSDVENVEAYLFKAFKRRLLREIHRLKKRTSLGLSDDLLDYEFPLQPSIQSEFINEEEQRSQQDRLAEALKRLTPRQREAIFLKYQQKLSFAEVAQVMEIETKAIYKLMSRAINTLKENMKLGMLACTLLLSDFL
ncbi:sigma-70 family RNA polymerase sigma factor [Fulvivirga sp. M361]|uniref:RNA polymerase sigma factor n=1 Tax=Fulvivirga sp. M361 TaxID=2594266 RepID=UPI001179A4A5|nr:sigma-70 family RNA polymerase sigma factor [Fulvivirga sp. M361]TRX59568.1 sigma-70 family RNA polymerase sigma factor [Fulvivirga sp. M361]